MRRLLSEVTLTALSQAAAMAATIGMQILLARSVSVPEFGRLAGAQAMVLVVEGALVSRGAEAALQVLGQHWHDGEGTLKAIAQRLMCYDLILSGGGFFIFSVLAFLAAPAFGADSWKVVALGVAVPLQINYGMRRSLFLLNHLVRAQALFEISLSAAQILLALVLIPRFGSVGFIATVLCAAASKNLLVHIWTQPLWRAVRAATAVVLDPVLHRTIRISSLHSVLRNLLSNGASNADVLFISLTGRPEAVAIYRVAKTLSSIPVKLAAPLWVVLRPRLLSALRAGDHRRYCALVIKAAALFAVGSMVVVAGTAILGGPVLSHFYGHVYASALRPLIILIVGTSVFGAVTGWLGFTMIISPRKTLGTALFAAQLTLIAGAGWLVGGQSAAAMATVVAGCNIVISAIAWWALLAGRFRHAT